MGEMHFDISQLKQFKNNMKQLEESRVDTFCRDCAKELAARLLRKVIKRTPIAKSIYGEISITDDEGKAVNYKRGVKKGQAKVKQVRVHTGGTLRRGWTGGVSVEATAYAATLGIRYNGTSYTIDIVNPVEYAPYVEFGHRQTLGRYVPVLGKRLSAAFVPGQFMLSISEKEIKEITPSLLRKRLHEMLKEAFHG